jgi:hypothetical protein
MGKVDEERNMEEGILEEHLGTGQKYGHVYTCTPITGHTASVQSAD